MKIKVCGMRNPDNITELAKLPIDFMGLIFYPKSSRYVSEITLEQLSVLPRYVERVGVFVDENIDVIFQKANEYILDLIQLHGNESVKYCKELNETFPIIKAISVTTEKDIDQVKAFGDIWGYFLFDTKTSQHGGSGQKFDWNILEAYTGNTPFFLSGGISPEDVEAIKKIQHPQLYGLDINSRFEIEPGLKNVELIDKFIKEIRS